MSAYKNVLFLLSAIGLFTLSCPIGASAEDMRDMISHGSIKKDLLNFSEKKRWEKMRRSDAREDHGKLINEILFINDQSKALASLEWLRDIIKSGEETDYAYPYMYAMQLHRSKYVSPAAPEAEITARAMAYYSKILLMTDAARCDDNGVGTSRFLNLSKALSVVDEETKHLPYDIKRIAMNIAFFLEDKYKNRQKQPLICESGAGFMARAMQSEKTKQEETLADKGNKEGLIPGSRIITVIPGDDVEIFYVSDEEWHKKREKIRDMFSKSLSKEKK